jgi:hypothetical protein
MQTRLDVSSAITSISISPPLPNLGGPYSLGKASFSDREFFSELVIDLLGVFPLSMLG